MVKLKDLKTMKISAWRLLAYFVIYSVAGYIVETIFCIVKYGVFESRQSFLYGPFCAIYGVGAIVIIVFLKPLKKRFSTIFLGGAVVGSILEFVISFIGELLFNVKWWDYSQYPLNLNGRICLYYSIFWGLLSLFLILSLNPKVDLLIDWTKTKISRLGKNAVKITVVAIIVWMVVDMFLTGQALTFFMVRTIKNYDIDVANREKIDDLYEKIYSSEERTKWINMVWGDKKMLQTFPRLKITDSNGNIIYFSDLLTDIQPYYVKIWDGSSNK